MTTIEELESNVDWIIKRYKDIDEENEKKIKENRVENSNIAFILPIIIIAGCIAFAAGFGYGLIF